MCVGIYSTKNWIFVKLFHIRIAFVTQPNQQSPTASSLADIQSACQAVCQPTIQPLTWHTHTYIYAIVYCLYECVFKIKKYIVTLLNGKEKITLVVILLRWLVGWLFGWLGWLTGWMISSESCIKSSILRQNCWRATTIEINPHLFLLMTTNC